MLGKKQKTSECLARSELELTTLSDEVTKLQQEEQELDEKKSSLSKDIELFKVQCEKMEETRRSLVADYDQLRSGYSLGSISDEDCLANCEKILKKINSLEGMESNSPVTSDNDGESNSPSCVSVSPSERDRDAERRQAKKERIAQMAENAANKIQDSL